MKKIIFFSGNRAEISFQKKTIEFLKNKINYHFVVSGSHLKNDFGNSIKEILKEDVKISDILNIKYNTKSVKDLNPYSSLLYSKLSNIFKKNKFDAAFVFSDRFESFIFSIVAFLNQIPIIHYEGGDTTEGGTYDDKIRNAISQISNIHLVTNNLAEKKLIKFGIKKKKISNVGLLSLHENYDTKKKLFDVFLKKNNISKKTKFLLFTFHSIPSDKKKNKYKIIECAKALKCLAGSNWIVIITSPNFDPFYDDIKKELKKLSLLKNVVLKNNLGNQIYQSLLEFAGKNKNGICIGNSSSGIKEANFLKCPSINLGRRQHMRLKPKSVFDCKIIKKNIINMVEKVYKLNLKKKIEFEKNLYFKKNSRNLMIKKVNELLSNK